MAVKFHGKPIVVYYRGMSGFCFEVILRPLVPLPTTTVVLLIKQ